MMLSFFSACPDECSNRKGQNRDGLDETTGEGQHSGDPSSKGRKGQGEPPVRNGDAPRQNQQVVRTT